MKFIKSKYHGKCKCCGFKIEPGCLIGWSKETGSLCLSCTYPKDKEIPLVELEVGKEYTFLSREGLLHLTFRGWTGQNKEDAFFHVHYKTVGGNGLTLHDFELAMMHVRARLKRV